MNDPEALSLEEIQGIASGEIQPIIEGLEEEQALEPEAEEEIEPNPEEEVEPLNFDDNPQVEEEEPKEPRSKTVPYDRLQEVIQQRDANAKQMEDMRRQLEQTQYELQRVNQTYTDFFEKAASGKTEEVDDDNEVLDTVLKKQVDTGLEEIKKQQEQLQRQQVQQSIFSDLEIAKQSVPDLDSAYGHVVESLARDLVDEGKYYGQQVNPQEAQARANQQVAAYLEGIKSANPGAQAGAILYQEALKRGYQAKKSGQKQQASVNMKEVERARQQAGAPTIEKQQVNVDGHRAFQNKLKELDSDMFDANYLKKLGVPV